LENSIFSKIEIEMHTYSSERVTGVLFFTAVTQFVLGLAVAEALYPDFNLSGPVH
jgi:hypothetical protein